MDWKNNIVADEAGVKALLADTRTIAVLGIKTEAQSGQPAFYVASYMVNVFRRSEDVPPHVDDILAKKPKSVWMQLGIRNDPVAEKLARAGIKVVQNRCIMVDHRQYSR